MSLLNRRDDYFNLLKGKRQENILMPMKPQEVEDLLSKLIDSRGKDRPRLKFNYMTN